jgi:hypothetical protein
MHSHSGRRRCGLGGGGHRHLHRCCWPASLEARGLGWTPRSASPGKLRLPLLPPAHRCPEARCHLMKALQAGRRWGSEYLYCRRRFLPWIASVWRGCTRRWMPVPLWLPPRCHHIRLLLPTGQLLHTAGLRPTLQLPPRPLPAIASFGFWGVGCGRC